mmetsp:Transcript_12026/g.31407  ORF Transcript_12026/g.31407 Transcript_12026/m.31407 type:complete len:212 (-) Transcript_12026:8-643(-)
MCRRRRARRRCSDSGSLRKFRRFPFLSNDCGHVTHTSCPNFLKFPRKSHSHELGGGAVHERAGDVHLAMANQCSRDLQAFRQLELDCAEPLLSARLLHTLARRGGGGLCEEGGEARAHRLSPDTLGGGEGHTLADALLSSQHDCKLQLRRLQPAEHKQRADAQLRERVRNTLQCVGGRRACGGFNEEEERLGHVEELLVVIGIVVGYYINC